MYIYRPLLLYVMQSMVDISADEGWLSTTLRVMHMVQMCVQGRWLSDPSVLILPHFTVARLNSLKQIVERSSVRRNYNIMDCSSLPELLVLYRHDANFMASAILKAVQSESQAKEVCISSEHIISLLGACLIHELMRYRLLYTGA